MIDAQHLTPLSAVVFLVVTLILFRPIRSGFKTLFLAKVKKEFIKEASKATNGAKVTVGAVYLSLYDGVFEAKDIVVHTPNQKEWGWASPLIGRSKSTRRRGHLRTGHLRTGHPSKSLRERSMYYIYSCENV